MTDCKFRLSGPPQPEPAAPIPALSEARVKRQCTVNQFDSGVDVLAKVSKYVRGASQDTWVVTCDLKCPPCQTEPLALVAVKIRGKALRLREQRRNGNRVRLHA